MLIWWLEKCLVNWVIDCGELSHWLWGWICSAMPVIHHAERTLEPNKLFAILWGHYFTLCSRDSYELVLDLPCPLPALFQLQWVLVPFSLHIYPFLNILALVRLALVYIETPEISMHELKPVVLGLLLQNEILLKQFLLIHQCFFISKPFILFWKLQYEILQGSLKVLSTELHLIFHIRLALFFIYTNPSTLPDLEHRSTLNIITSSFLCYFFEVHIISSYI